MQPGGFTSWLTRTSGYPTNRDDVVSRGLDPDDESIITVETREAQDPIDTKAMRLSVGGTGLKVYAGAEPWSAHYNYNPGPGEIAYPDQRTEAQAREDAFNAVLNNPILLSVTGINTDMIPPEFVNLIKRLVDQAFSGKFNFNGTFRDGSHSGGGFRYPEQRNTYAALGDGVAGGRGVVMNAADLTIWRIIGQQDGRFMFSLNDLAKEFNPDTTPDWSVL